MPSAAASVRVAGSWLAGSNPPPRISRFSARASCSNSAPWPSNLRIMVPVVPKNSLFADLEDTTGFFYSHISYVADDGSSWQALARLQHTAEQTAAYGTWSRQCRGEDLAMRTLIVDHEP